MKYDEENMNGAITISRPSGGRDECISIRIQDSVSGIEFVSLELKLDDYARLLTGLAYVPAKMITKGLENVGKMKQRQRASVTISGTEYSKLTKGVSYDETKNRLGEWLKTAQAREGWMVDAYLGSQGSVVYNQDGSKTLNFGYYRYVEKSNS